jgi:pyruvate/2-oxoglutarate dehydrogenase complex dihydrolipoamide dehydrogenase (E3) component
VVSTQSDYDAVVIGAGEAGTVLASLAVEAGRRVALVYREPWGSTCLNVGCVPSKFLIHRARVAHVARTADRFGIRTGNPTVNLASIVEEKQAMVAGHRAESWHGALSADGLELVEGGARFLSRSQVRVGERILRADRVFIATGMRPVIPPIPGLEDGPYLTNETVMDLTSVPEHLVVIGGGYIGCELGQAFHRFGSHVTIVQRGDRLVREEDEDASMVLGRAFAAEGINVLLDTEVRSVSWSGGRATVEMAGPDGRAALEASHVLVAAGRRPNTDGLDLAAAGVDADDRGFVVVDDWLSTSAAGIWAVGDVNGQQPFTRVCQEEAKVAYANAF